MQRACYKREGTQAPDMRRLWVGLGQSPIRLSFQTLMARSLRAGQKLQIQSQLRVSDLGEPKKKLAARA